MECTTRRLNGSTAHVQAKTTTWVWSRAKRLWGKTQDFGRLLILLAVLYLYYSCISNQSFHEAINLHMTWVPLAMGDTIILVEIDSNDSKISMQIPKECPPMPANDSVEIQRRPELTFRCQPMHSMTVQSASAAPGSTFISNRCRSRFSTSTACLTSVASRAAWRTRGRRLSFWQELTAMAARLVCKSLRNVGQ